jgi:hypothetical protein
MKSPARTRLDRGNCWLPLVWCGLFAATVAGAADLPSKPPAAVFDEEMSGYRRTEPSGAVTALQKRIERGEAKLVFDAKQGYLPSLLRELALPASSQLLVFSKTSPLRHFISPHNPRALYFNDHVWLAYVPDAPNIELAAADPRLGVAFYTVEQKASSAPAPVRDDRCLECHATAKTLGVPGLLVRSFLTDQEGDVDLLSGRSINHRTPIAERWGGYYVTGQHGNQPHLGNLFGAEPIAKHRRDPLANGNLADLRRFLDTSKYPGPGSDLIALLVLDHQVHMHNLLTRLGYEAQAALRDAGTLTPAAPAVEAVLKYLLFAEEAPMGSAVAGSSAFASAFEKAGPRDKQGRSLRQFDLQTRLFKFPCSFMIYSESWSNLPAAARKRLYKRLWDVLNGEDASPEFRHLGADTRRALREILTETKNDLPAWWAL